MRIERASLKDLQEMKYLLQTNTKIPVSEENSSGEVEYIEIDGELVPIETGFYNVGHEQETQSGELVDKIVTFYGNISFSGGETHLEEYGVNSADYDAVLVMPKDSLPITETSYIWYDSDPVYQDGTLVDSESNPIETSNGQTVTVLTGRVDTSSADFKVVKVIPSLGFKRYLLKAVIH